MRGDARQQRQGKRGQHAGRDPRARMRADRRRGQQRRLWLEPLEDRRLLAAVPQLLAQTMPGADGAWPHEYVQVGSLVFFPGEGTDLWTSDGTPGGTVKAVTISHPDLGPNSYINDIAAVGGVLALTVADNNGTWLNFDDDRMQLWKTDGSSMGTHLVKDFGPGSSAGFSGGTYLTEVAGKVYFSLGAQVGDPPQPTGNELWASDLDETNPEGTYLVKDLAPGADSSSPYDLLAFNGKLYFAADDGTHGRELWMSDGTSDGTVLVKDINGSELPPPDNFGSYPTGLAAGSGKFFFGAFRPGEDSLPWTEDDYVELWQSDGTPDGTVPIHSFEPGLLGGQPQLTYIPETGLLFGVATTYDAAGPEVVESRDLFCYDGSNTFQVLNINPGGDDAVHGLFAAGDMLGFAADNGTDGLEPWATDGSPAGTYLVKDINPWGDSMGWWGGVFLDDAAYFVADDGVHGGELWTSDGTDAGTVLVADIEPLPGDSSYPYNLTAVLGKLFFTARNDAVGGEPWVLDPQLEPAFDFGDAPAPYPTQLASDGARHVITPGIHLGSVIDAEADGQPEALALGDDNAGIEDEDGVELLRPLTPGRDAELAVTASTAGILNAWLDMNDDGDWDDEGEHFATNQSLTAGLNRLAFPLPVTVAPTETTLARFRFSTFGNLGYGGMALDGEVEDYQAAIGQVRVFEVDSTGDGADANLGDGVCDDGTGRCTLRAAIQQANAASNLAGGADWIVFDIAGDGPHTIQPASVLPTITEAVVIDATSQPGYAGTPLVELNGSSAGGTTSGLAITAGNSTVMGLAVNRFGRDAIQITGTGGNRLQANFLGTAPGGTIARANGRFGVYLASPNNQIGGSGVGEANLISGNTGSGIYIAGAGSTGNVLEGNRIGTNAAGTAALPNGGYGIDLRAPQTTIGGTEAGAGNVISGNQAGGVQLSGADAYLNTLQGNRIGTNAAGTAAIFNRGPGVTLSGAASNTLGGGASGAGNLISGNGTHGVYIAGAGASGNVLLGNLIGTNLAGTAAIPNASQGVYITSANNSVGGTGAGEGNVISGNLSSGLYLNTATATANRVRNNLIGTDRTGALALGNARYGIDLRGPGNVIGGVGTDEGNVVSANGVDGIFVYTVYAAGNIIYGNAIGTDISGTADLGNRYRGVVIYAPGTMVGGVGGAGNLISGNDTHGLFIADPVSSGTVVAGNLIGTEITGQAALPNGSVGVYVAAPNNTLAGNVISGNGAAGVYLVGSGASGNTLQGNTIGLNFGGGTVVANAGFGIDVRGPTNTIGGTEAGAGNLISGNTGGGVQLTSSNAHSNVVQGNWIGTDISGLLDRGNGGPGVSIAIASRNTVGGATAAARNVISGNDHYGVQIAGTSTNQNVVAGNYIGTDATGAAKLGNSRYGVYLSAANNRIGGSAAGEGSVISGNGQGGLYIVGSGTTGNVVQGNRIGTNAAGTAALGNTSVGIDLRAPQTTIGGAATGAGNLISGNGAAGIQVFGADATLNQIQGNRIGTDVTGTVDLGNTGAGVSIASGASGNTVGGTAAGAGNVIMGNNSRGIIVSGAGTLRNAIRQNSMFQNTALGLDLNGDNFTANDAGDPDEGPNRLQNFPEIETAVLSGSTLTIHYSVPSVEPNSTFPLVVEFFLADVDRQEGQRYLGGESYPAAGPDSVVLTVSDVSVGQQIVVTATDANGNTSEFSTSVTIAAAQMSASLPEGEVTDSESRVAGFELREAGFVTRDMGRVTRDTALVTRDAGRGTRDGSYDLLTAVLHEMGRVLGMDDDQDGWMADVLPAGEQKLPDLADLDAIFAEGEWSDAVPGFFASASRPEA